MTDIKQLTKMIVKFRDDRNWKQFHNSKDVALSLVLEASEVMEHFQWKNDQEIKTYIQDYRSEIGEELSDVLYWVLLMSHDLKIDIGKELVKKMQLNEKKYPISKAKNSHKKYTEL